MSRAGVAREQLLDLELGALQSRDALAVELLASPEETDRIIHGDVAALQARDDLVELALEVLERARLGHGEAAL